MKVLIINELAKSGGAEMQTMRECSLLRQYGNEAIVITLDPSFKQGWNSEYHYNISRKDSVLKREMQMVFADRSITKEIKAIIDDFGPDYIHLNNSKAHALSIYKAIKGYFPIYCAALIISGTIDIESNFQFKRCLMTLICSASRTFENLFNKFKILD